MSAPLADIVVVDLTRALSGPQTAMMLGDLGARVIKVELPDIGDDSRGWGPPFVGPDGDQSTYYLAANRNKQSIALDLKSASGMAVVTRLVRRADVLLENFRVGTLERLGLSVERLHELNPRLVIGSISAFGHDGPQADRLGYDLVAQAEAGLMSVTGPDPHHPQRIGAPLADLLAGMNLAYGIAAALFERERTGRGRVVRTSMLASVVGVHALHGTAYTVAGAVGRARGNHHPSIAPYGLFECRDGRIVLAVAAENLWVRFATGFGLDPAAPGLATNGDRVRNRDATVAAVEAVFADWYAEPLVERLTELGVPAGKVRAIDEVYEWDQVASQHLLIDVDHPVLGRVTIPGPTLRFDDNAYAGGRPEHLPPPLLGEHTAEILAWLDAQDAEASASSSDLLYEPEP